MLTSIELRAAPNSAGNFKIWENTPKCDIDFGHCNPTMLFLRRSVGPALCLAQTLFIAGASSSTIPIIDLAGFLSLNASQASKADVAKAWDTALKTFGFAAIVNHGVAEETQSGLFDAALAFFRLPRDDKLRTRSGQAYGDGNGGFTPVGVESASRTLGRNAPPDLVENFVYLASTLAAASEGIDNGPAASMHAPAQAYWTSLGELVGHLHELSALALGLPETHFFRQFYEPDPKYALRLAYYPPLDDDDGDINNEQGQGECKTKAVRYGAHTDYQGFTVLLPDPRRPGLEVYPPHASSGESLDAKAWIPMHEGLAEAGALVVNIGDLMQQWTNDRWHSTLHRVSNPPEGSPARKHDRLSLAFFTGPRENAVIEVLPECIAPGDQPKYAPVRSGDHLRAKLTASNV
jgi:isopenicillin N synthase-like dioxygenase